MPYLIDATDRHGVAELRRARRPDHLAYLESKLPILIAVGAKLSDDGAASLGSLYLINVNDRASAEAFIAGDPYVKAGVFGEVRVTRWRKGFFDGKRIVPRGVTEAMDAIVPESARNISFVGWSDQGGRADGAQIMVNKRHAFVAHPFSAGLTVINVNDPRAPKPVAFLPVHPRSWSIHCQAHGDLLLVIEEFDFFKLQVKDYYGQSLDLSDPELTGKRGVNYSAGIRVYDISNPASPRSIGFMEVDGFGVHRMWWDGGRYVYATALLHGYTDHILMIVNLARPTKPMEVSRWWLPGMWKAGGETNDFKGRVALHHAIVAGDTACAAWRNGGVTLLDVKDKSAPKLIAHRNWCPPFGGNTHTALPLPDRSLLVVDDEASDDIAVEPVKHTWIFDVRVPENPISIATVPVPSDQDYVAKGGQFGPHNLWENRQGGFATSDYVFATYQSAGLRVFDIRNPFRPEEVAYFVPPPPKGWFDPRTNIERVLHSVNVWVDPDGLMYLTDYNAGLYILQWDRN